MAKNKTSWQLSCPALFKMRDRANAANLKIKTKEVIKNDHINTTTRK